MELSEEEVFDLITYQVGAVQGFCQVEGVPLNHVKVARRLLFPPSTLILPPTLIVLTRFIPRTDIAQPHGGAFAFRPKRSHLHWCLVRRFLFLPAHRTLPHTALYFYILQSASHCRAAVQAIKAFNVPFCVSTHIPATRLLHSF